MSNTSDFVIEKGVLEIYRGNETTIHNLSPNLID